MLGQRGSRAPWLFPSRFLEFASSGGVSVPISRVTREPRTPAAVSPEPEDFRQFRNPATDQRTPEPGSSRCAEPGRVSPLHGGGPPKEQNHSCSPLDPPGGQGARTYFRESAAVYAVKAGTTTIRPCEARKRARKPSMKPSRTRKKRHTWPASPRTPTRRRRPRS